MLSPLHHSNSLAGLYMHKPLLPQCFYYICNIGQYDDQFISDQKRILSIPCFYFNGVFVPVVKTKNVNFKMSPSTD